VIPIELEINNFLAYRNPGPLSFEGIHIVCLAGPNGAGKSSLLDAITWVLWGKARTNAPDELIHLGQDNMSVSLTFEQGGIRYRVIRKRRSGKRGESVLEFQGWDAEVDSWQSLSEATIRGTQARIETLLRLDYETFVNSAFLMQGRADEFTTKTPNQRKQVLSNILGLSLWEKFESLAKERVNQTSAEIQRIDGGLAEMERELSQEEVFKAELTEAESAAKKITDQLEDAEKRWTDLEQIRSQLNAIHRQMDDLRQRIRRSEADISDAEQERDKAEAQSNKAAIQSAQEEIITALSKLEPLAERHRDITDEITTLSKETAHLKGINEALIPETEPIKNRIITLEAATEPICPTCGQPLTDEHRNQLLQELNAEIEQRREKFRLNRDTIQEREARIRELQNEASNLDQALSERADLQMRISELQAALGRAEEAADRISSLSQRITRWSADLVQDQAKLQELEQQAEVHITTLSEASITKDEIEQLRLEKRMADERVGGARQKLAALSTLKELKQKRLAERDLHAENLGLYEELRNAFSKRGVPAMIIETSVPELERSANELLARMTEGRMAVRIETQREIKSGELREALDIIISDELGTRPYDLYSGGESFRINFAIRIALSRLLAHRAGAQLRSLYIDEGFGTQDAVGREQLVAAINSIQEDFDLILVITHIDEMKEAFPVRIEVSKTPQGSKFELN
jgi:exonuclease SbcC